MAVINGRVYAVGEALRVGAGTPLTPTKPGSSPPGGAAARHARSGRASAAKSAAVATKEAPPSVAADSAGAVYKIVDVLPDRVLLELEGNRMELKYPDTPSRSAPERSTAAKRGRERSRAPGVEKARGNGRARHMASPTQLTELRPLLIQLLLEKEILSAEQVETLGEVRAKDHGSLESVLVKKGLVPDQHIAEVYADYLMLPLFDSPPETADVRLANLLPEKLCHDHMFVPVGMSEDTLDVAFATFEDMLMVDELQLLTGMTIRPMITPAFGRGKDHRPAVSGHPYEVPRQHRGFHGGGGGGGRRNQQADERTTRYWTSTRRRRRDLTAASSAW